MIALQMHQVRYLGDSNHPINERQTFKLLQYDIPKIDGFSIFEAIILFNDASYLPSLLHTRLITWRSHSLSYSELNGEDSLRLRFDVDV